MDLKTVLSHELDTENPKHIETTTKTKIESTQSKILVYMYMKKERNAYQ